MACLVSLSVCSEGKVKIPFRSGRKDATEANLPGLLPLATDTLDDLTKDVERMGLSLEDGHGITAGTHTIA
jgi:hypothetical protein